MSSAIQKLETVTVDVGQQSASDWSKERKELVKRTVAPDATDAELEMFLHISSRSGLDPLRKQIHFMKHGGRVTIVADINGLQARAAREADFEGIAHAVVYEGDDVVVNNAEQRIEKHTSNPFTPKGRLLGAWAVVYRRGKKPFMDVSLFAEFNNSNNANWKTKPAVMMDKVSKSRALRLAYPEQLGNVYEGAEVDAPEREAGGMSAENLSKPTMPATTATREAMPPLQMAPETVEAEVVPANTVQGVGASHVVSREPGSDDVDEGPGLWETWVAELATVSTREAFKTYADRAKSLPSGSAGRKAMSKALRDADTHLKALGL